MIRLNSQRATASSHRLAAVTWPQSPQKARFSPSFTLRQHDDTTLAAGALVSVVPGAVAVPCVVVLALALSAMDLGLDYFGPWVWFGLCIQDRAMAGRGGWGKPPGPSGLYRTLRLALASAGYKSEISLKVPQLKLSVRVTGLLRADHEQHGPGHACMPGAAPQKQQNPGGIRHSGSSCHAHASGSDPIYLRPRQGPGAAGLAGQTSGTAGSPVHCDRPRRPARSGTWHHGDATPTGTQ